MNDKTGLGRAISTIDTAQYDPNLLKAKEDPATGRVSGGSFADQELVREIRGARTRFERLQALERDWPKLSEDSKAEIAALFYRAGGR